ncbi:MAG TPA: hypothetical protein QF708_04620, partial [Candidatus Poseidoniia archaeon]|nr:hypothetical protein [Candidatus Poseidoniia archaeon]
DVKNLMILILETKKEGEIEELEHPQLQLKVPVVQPDQLEQQAQQEQVGQQISKKWLKQKLVVESEK